MTVQDDVRRLSQLDSVFLGQGFNATPNTGASVCVWHKGRVQQANDGSWIFRSISAEGTIVGFQLGKIDENYWSSNETPSTGITITIAMNPPVSNASLASICILGGIYLAQQLPGEITN